MSYSAEKSLEHSLATISLESSNDNKLNDGICEIESQQKTYVITEEYGNIKDENGQKVKVTKYTLVNRQNLFVEIINYGATVVSCWVPNAQGELEDVLLGFDSIDDYKFNNLYSIGSTLGRVTDYISYGVFKNEKGDMNELSKNRGCHHFNGGVKGFDKVMWDGYVSGNDLILTYSSKDGEEGYPGTFQTRITFCLTCKNELIIDYVGMTSKSTPVNITSNMFFNLAGHNTGESELINHSIMVNANEYVAIKIPERRPVGSLKYVQHTCLDLRVPRSLKKAFPLVPGFGYNHTFKLFKGGERKAFNLAASLLHKQSGRILDIYTDMPCVCVNTAQEFPEYGKMSYKEEVMKVTEIATPNAKFGINENDQQASSISDEYRSKSDLDSILLEDEQEDEYDMGIPLSKPVLNIQDTLPIVGKSNVVYSKHSGICIRPQLFPDALAHKSFNDITLKPSNLYSQRTIYKFGVIMST